MRKPEKGGKVNTYFVTLKNGSGEEKKLVVIAPNWGSMTGGMSLALEFTGEGWEVDSYHELKNAYVIEVKITPNA